MAIIQLRGVGLSFPHKTCFSDFDGAIQFGERIAIVGDNGSGKSSLLRMLSGQLSPSEGTISTVPGLGIGYLEQLHDSPSSIQRSGGERVNHALSQALVSASAGTANLLLLDEPTNHLDAHNQRALARMLQKYEGSIVLVTHDEKIMNQVCHTIWHIEHNQIQIFHGRYADYLEQQQSQRDAIERKLATIKRREQEAHDALMREQQRASHARQRGVTSIKNRKWATIKSPTKLGRGNATAGQKQSEIRAFRRELVQQKNQLPVIDVIEPSFHLPSTTNAERTVLQIENGAVGYEQPLVKNLYISLEHGQRLALTGANGSGKSTLARAIAQRPALILAGNWTYPAAHQIGYLDQHYANLDPEHSVLQTLKHAAPHWCQLELRRHLSDFLFRHDGLINSLNKTLSGGEKARLSLACIAARPPQLLILDELTNNLDRRMRQHVIEILRNYPGALLLISHDEDFLQAIGRVQRVILSR